MTTYRMTCNKKPGIRNGTWGVATVDKHPGLATVACWASKILQIQRWTFGMTSEKRRLNPGASAGFRTKPLQVPRAWRSFRVSTYRFAWSRPERSARTKCAGRGGAGGAGGATSSVNRSHPNCHGGSPWVAVSDIDLGSAEAPNEPGSQLSKGRYCKHVDN